MSKTQFINSQAVEQEVRRKQKKVWRLQSRSSSALKLPDRPRAVAVPKGSGKSYEGKRVAGEPIITVNGGPLNPRFDLWNYHPSEFEWGYDGYGTAQLALALLADALNSDAVAKVLHQDFKRAVVVKLPYEGWKLTDEQIRRTTKGLINKRGSLAFKTPFGQRLLVQA